MIHLLLILFKFNSLIFNVENGRIRKCDLFILGLYDHDDIKMQMEYASFLSNPITVPIITQVLLFYLLYKHQTKVGEKIKLEYVKQSISYQISQTEYVKLRFERVNELFTQLIEQKDYIEEVSPFFINHYKTFDFTKEYTRGKELRSKIKETLMRTSFYIDKDSRALVTEYIRISESLTALANNWGISQIQIEIIQSGKIIHHENGVPVELSSLLRTQPIYLENYEKDRTQSRVMFEQIESALRSLLEVS